MEYINEMEDNLKRIERVHVNHEIIESGLKMDIEECSKQDFDLNLLTPEIIRDTLFDMSYPYSELNDKEKELFDQLIKTIISKLYEKNIVKDLDDLIIKALLEINIIAKNNEIISPELFLYYRILISDYMDLRIDGVDIFDDEEDYRDILYLEKKLRDENIIVNDYAKEIRDYLGEHVSDNLINIENEFSTNNGLGGTSQK